MTNGDGYTLTSEQAATQLGVPIAAIRLWLWSGQLPGYRVGGNTPGWRIRAKDLRQFRTALTANDTRSTPTLTTNPQEET